MVESDFCSHSIRISGIASCIGKHMTALLDGNKVVTDGTTDSKLALLVGGDDLTILGANGAIDVEVGALQRVVGAGIEHLTANGERTDVLEIHATMVDG